MKPWFLFFTLTLFSSFSSAAMTDVSHLFEISDVHAAAEGAIDGGSVGDGEVKASAWFVDANRPISYCQVHSPDFSLTSAETAQVLRKAFSRWRGYIQNITAANPQSPLAAIATQAVETDCTDADVTFYFGYEDPVINEDRKVFSHPLAYVLRKSPSKETWGKGYAWFNKRSFSRLGADAPRWAASAQLEVLALHEIGHIHGFGHVAGTIMDDRAIYQNFTRPVITTFLTIDRDRLLVMDHPLQLSGSLGTGDAAHFFTKLTGHAPRGQVQARLTGDAFHPQLIVSDEATQSQKKIVFMGKGQISSHSSQNSAFLIQTHKDRREVKDGIRVIYGHVRGADGLPLNLIAEYNMNRQTFNVGPVVLRVQDGDEMKVLFQSFYSQIRCPQPQPGTLQPCGNP